MHSRWAVLFVLTTASHAQSRAYLIEDHSDQLFTVDLTTGAATLVGSTATNGLTGPSDLTWRDDTAQLWTIDRLHGVIGTLDTSTGAFTPVYQTGMWKIEALAWDARTSRFYFAGISNLYALDPATGVTTLVGKHPLPSAGSLETDAADVLLISDLSTGALHQTSKQSGVLIQVGHGMEGMTGWSIDHADGSVYGSSTIDNSLYLLDPLRGTRRRIGPHGAGIVFPTGFEIANAPAVASTYCLSKPNALGCLPAITFTGFPEAASTGGFHVTASPVRNARPGLFFYRTGGSQFFQTFQCGTLCFGPSGIRRSPVVNSGGNAPPSNDCSGAYTLDFSAFAAGLLGGNPDPALRLVGTTVRCQSWGPDPGFQAPCDSTLSNALEYLVE